jgi:hypothetical protein
MAVLRFSALGIERMHSLGMMLSAAHVKRHNSTAASADLSDKFEPSGACLLLSGVMGGFGSDFRVFT